MFNDSVLTVQFMATCLNRIARVIIAVAVAAALWLPVAAAMGPQGVIRAVESGFDLVHQDEAGQNETASNTQFQHGHVHHTSDHTHDTPHLVQLFVSNLTRARAAGRWESSVSLDGSDGARLERPPRI